MKGFCVLLFIIVIVLIFMYFTNQDYKNQKQLISHNDSKTELILYKGDITKIKIECIVNASNPSGLGCNIPNHCVDSAIHHAAGS